MSSAELNILWGLGAVCLLFILGMLLFLVAVNKLYLMGRRQSVEAFHLFSVSMFIITYSGYKPVSRSQLNFLVTRKGISVFSSVLLMISIQNLFLPIVVYAEHLKTKHMKRS